MGDSALIANTILEGIGEAIYSVSADWTVAFFNRQAELFFGRPRQDIVGRSLWDCFPTARDSDLANELRRVMSTRSPIEMITRGPSTGRWTDTRVFPLEDGGIAVSWRDVTEQRAQEAALADALQNQARLLTQLRTVTDHVPAMIAYWDSGLKCRSANASYMEWFGRSPDEMLGISMQELMGKELFAKNEPYVRAVLAGERQSFERVLTKPTGETGHTWAQYIPEIDPEGKVRGFYVLVTDVTPLKRAEERLQETNAELKAARDEAEAATAVKSAFLSNMSHELRNPLTSIIGYVDLLAKRGNLSGLELKYLTRVQDASEALLTTINDVLDFSKLEAGQIEIERRAADPAAVALRALEMFEPELQQKGLTQRFDESDMPARVLIDETRVRQILTNLIGNAVKFTAVGSVGVRCLYIRDAQMLRFEVTDTGPGIPPDRVSRLFQRFSQVDASTTRTFGGTGLGLAICKGLAEAMGGQVGVRSAPGQGSLFWVEIPAEPVDLGDQQQADAVNILTDPDALRGLKVLVVDDEQANRELVRLIVEPLGVEVTEADGGSQAVSKAAAEAFDLILMDIRMPEIDGPTAAQIIRSAPGPNASTTMVAFTADAPREMPAAWAACFVGVLVKPVASADLVLMLAACRAASEEDDGKREQASSAS